MPKPDLRRVAVQKPPVLFLKTQALLRQFTRRLAVLVPLECTPAATMLALGADSIQRGPGAHFSAVDSALTRALSPVDRDNDRVGVSADELVRVLRLWREESRGGDHNPSAALYPHVHPLVIGAVDRASSLSAKLCTEILSYHMKDRRMAVTIANRLNSNYPSHNYPTTLREARRAGLKATSLDPALNDLLLAQHEARSITGRKATTDFDAFNPHDESILNIIEGRGFQMHCQRDKDWHYRREERRRVPLNDRSGWRRTELLKGEVVTSVYHNN